MAKYKPESPIFIHGILKRSGTNYLAELLKLHPDCGSPDPIYEDWLLHSSTPIEKFVIDSYNRWAFDLKWNVTEDIKDELYAAIGQALIAFLKSRVGSKRLLTKTPNVENLLNFFKLFPQAYLLILIRDGRDIAESSEKSFSCTIENIARKWSHSAEIIQNFNKVYKNVNDRYLIVRYEDLVVNLEEEISKILKFLDLDIKSYNLEEAKNLKVFGSSSIKGKDNRFEYLMVEKTPDFNPIMRWSNWNRKKHERFNWIARELMPQFGYQPKKYNRYEIWWHLYNLFLDGINRFLLRKDCKA